MFTAAGKSAAASAANYIEDVFSTFLYTGNGSARTITNNIDLSGKGGLVWFKQRNTATDHLLFDTTRGPTNILYSNLTLSQQTSGSSLTAFNNNGFDIGVLGVMNSSGDTFASWTFREQAKFFDVVTYTGTGVARTISHNLGSVPGCIIVKRLNSGGNWRVYHRGMTSAAFMMTLDAASGESSQPTIWNSTAPTSTEFSVGTASDTNASGGTFVAYLFAHDAGGFGLTGSDNVITCGSVVGSGTTSVTLGYEPQWILMKNRTSAQDWWLVDNMRGLPAPSANARLLIPNKTDAEAALSVNINSTGFTTAAFSSGETYIYIAIRRGPMKTPTSGTSVYQTQQVVGPATQTAGFAVDFVLEKQVAAANTWRALDRLRGSGATLYPDQNVVQGSENFWFFDNSTGVYLSFSGLTNRGWMFQRAPGFFDVVCYTGTGSTRTVTHNLGVAPELVIYKARDFAADWVVYAQPITASNFLSLNTTAAQNSSVASLWNGIAPTSTNLTVVSNNGINGSGLNYVAYLFASCPGVSKVGSYTGTGALQTINCGFAAGARFVLIKRTDSTGDWWVYDSARGITSGNDPYLLLNSSAAEITNTNYVDTTSVGFQVTAAAPAGLNANGGTYIFLAIA